jgi:hypothetical protein
VKTTPFRHIILILLTDHTGYMPWREDGGFLRQFIRSGIVVALHASIGGGGVLRRQITGTIAQFSGAQPGVTPIDSGETVTEDERDDVQRSSTEPYWSRWST